MIVEKHRTRAQTLRDWAWAVVAVLFAAALSCLSWLAYVEYQQSQQNGARLNALAAVNQQLVNDDQQLRADIEALDKQLRAAGIRPSVTPPPIPAAAVPTPTPTVPRSERPSSIEVPTTVPARPPPSTIPPHTTTTVSSTTQPPRTTTTTTKRRRRVCLPAIGVCVA